MMKLAHSGRKLFPPSKAIEDTGRYPVLEEPAGYCREKAMKLLNLAFLTPLPTSNGNMFILEFDLRQSYFNYSRMFRPRTIYLHWKCLQMIIVRRKKSASIKQQVVTNDLID